MIKLLKFAHRLRGKIENYAFDKAAGSPEKTQRRFLLNLLRKNAETVFGRAHRFGDIGNEADFQKRIPVRDYEDYRPFINRIINGEPAILTAQNPLMFTMTSGTTGEPKYIPVTRESQNNNSRLMRQWLCRAESDHPSLVAQSSVGIVSRAVEGLTAGGLPFGSASGVIYKNIPRFIRRAYAVPYAVAEIKDYDDRYFALACFALAARISFIATPNPTTLLRFGQIIADNSDKLIRAIHDGKLGLETTKQSKLVAELDELLKPNPLRAGQLQAIAAKNGCLRPADCWADLKLIGCWLGGSVGVQVSKLSHFYGSVPLRDLGYLASEGNMTVPFSDDTSSGILALSNNFYEFVPENEIDDEQPTALFSCELEIGKRYGVLLTTAAGLYRYKINDIVEVTGFYRRAPLVSFVRKAGEMANITGEKMHANHFIQAFEAIRGEFNLKIEQFRAAPNYDLNCYEIYLELQADVSVEKLRRTILPAIDYQLQNANVEYKQKRQSKRLAAPRVHLMKRGWADDNLRRHIAAGKRDTQFKWQILLPEQSIKEKPFIAQSIEKERAKALVERI